MEYGKKFDEEKPRMHLLPSKSMFEVANVLTFGAQKYDEENWRKLENLQDRYSSGALRHIFAHIDGSELDEESGFSHLAHAICCLLFKLEIELEQKSEKERLRESNDSFDNQSDHTFKWRLSDNQKRRLRDAQHIVQHFSTTKNNR